jgi:hypothetical protein
MLLRKSMWGSKTQCQGTEAEFTVALKLNQGTLRRRGVIGGGALFGSFLGKQKGTAKKN